MEAQREAPPPPCLRPLPLNRAAGACTLSSSRPPASRTASTSSRQKGCTAAEGAMGKRARCASRRQEEARTSSQTCFTSGSA